LKKSGASKLRGSAPDLVGPQGDISDDSTFLSFALCQKKKPKNQSPQHDTSTAKEKTQEMDLEVSSVAEAAPPAPPARPPPTPAAATPHRRKPTKPVHHQSNQNEKSNDNFFNNNNSNGAYGGVGGAVCATPSGGVGVAMAARWSVSAATPLAEGAYVEVHFPELEGQRPPGTPSDPPQGVAVQVEASTCQLTHSLKPSGFNPCTSYEVKTRFQAFAFKCSFCAAASRRRTRGQRRRPRCCSGHAGCQPEDLPPARRGPPQNLARVHSVRNVSHPAGGCTS
jgi:hypothetical protein